MESHASAPELGRSPAEAIARLALYAEDLPKNRVGSTEEGLALCTVVGIHCGNGDFSILPGEGSISAA